MLVVALCIVAFYEMRAVAEDGDQGHERVAEIERLGRVPEGGVPKVGKAVHDFVWCRLLRVLCARALEGREKKRFKVFENRLRWGDSRLEVFQELNVERYDLIDIGPDQQSHRSGGGQKKLTRASGDWFSILTAPAIFEWLSAVKAERSAVPDKVRRRF